MSNVSSYKKLKYYLRDGKVNNPLTL